MKLLVDQNLSPRLVISLADLFPKSQHVRDVGLASSDDRLVWGFAASNGFAILSKDSDFHQMSFVLGAPPKVIWIQRGNCTTVQIEQLVRSVISEIRQFLEDPTAAFMSIR